MESSANPGRADDDDIQGEQDAFKTPLPPTDKSKGKKKEILEYGDERNSNGKLSKKLAARSWVWDHFTKKENDPDTCNCPYDKKSYTCPTKQGTSNLKKHLETCKQYKAWDGHKTQATINKEGKLKDAKISADVFREVANEMLVLGKLPLAFVESVHFNHFCDKCNLRTPHSRRTAARDIVKMFATRKASLKEWILATCASYMVITAHFVYSDWCLRKLILGFKYITDHKSNTIARVLLDCMVEWGIEKLFTITIDNVTANTIALKKFHEDFQLLKNDAFVLDGNYMHMRCCPHIINLIIKDGLNDLSDSVAAILNGVQYVRYSTHRCDSFEHKVVAGKMSRGIFPMDVKTRWNSTYLMLTKAMKFKLAFQKMEDEDQLYNDYFMKIENGKSRIRPPTYNDRRAIDKLVKFLGLFYTATLVVSASTNVCSYKCYGEIVTIEKSLEILSSSYYKELSSMAVDMRQKFSKYWDGIKNINKMLIVVSVFDPRKKMQFAKMCFEKLHGKDRDEPRICILMLLIS